MMDAPCREQLLKFGKPGKVGSNGPEQKRAAVAMDARQAYLDNQAPPYHAPVQGQNLYFIFVLQE